MLALLAHDLSYFTIGLLVAFRSLTINLLEIPSGAIADGFGRRHAMIFSLASYILSFILFAWATKLWMLFAAMFLYGVGDAFRTGTHKAMIFEWLRQEDRLHERTRIYGITRGWSQFGSALSAILAAGFVLLTRDYRTVFVAATVPYLLNVVNLSGYPRDLDGLTQQDTKSSLRSVAGDLMRTLGQAWRKASMRRLMAESMAWEGTFNAIKDYLQLALLLLFTNQLIAVATDSQNRRQIAEASDLALPMESVDPGVVIAIAVTYTVLFLLSGFASRQAHRVQAWCGSEQMASSCLWIVNLSLYILLGIADLSSNQVLVVLALVILNILQNIWRPILITRFDNCSSAGQGATILSIESQSQRLATFFIAPIVGLAVDSSFRLDSAGHLWPIAMIGVTVCTAIMVTFRRNETD